MSNLNTRKEALEIVKATLTTLSEQRGLTPRASQNQMISAVAKTLLDRDENEPDSGSHLLAVEAPTGTGKSFGYLLPAVPIALKTNKKVVVSTAVVSLQEQLIKKDLPALAEAMPVAFTYALAKGRSRFVCNTRLEKQKLAYEDLGFKNDGTFSVGSDSSQTEDADFTMKMYSSLESGKWNGEQETLTFGDDKQKKSVWPKVTTDSSGCSGKSCSAYKKCAYFKAKDIWMSADVVVANHDLVMSDLSTSGGGKLLPNPEETIYIFDEAHHVPGKVRDAFAFNFRTDTFKKLPKEVASFLNDLEDTWKDEKCGYASTIARTLRVSKKEYQQSIKEFNHNLEKFIEMVQALASKATPKEPYLVPYLDEPATLGLITETLHQAADNVLTHIKKTYDSIFEARKTLFKANDRSSIIMDDTEYNRVAGALGFYKNRFTNMHTTLGNILREQPPKENPPLAKWFTPVDEKNKEFVVNFSPTMATDILPSNLFDKAYSVIFTSATMTSVGGFQLFKQKTGMCYYENARTMKLDSPFDFKKNATLVFGDVGGDVKNAEFHTKRLYEVIPQLLEDYKALGTLILFTSKSQMEQVVQKLPYHVRSRCKVQYTMPNNALIEQHKADIDAGHPSILIGTQSFSEGLDLPGAWCSVVFCTKLPFSVPDNPIDKTLTSWLESQGRNVFKEIAVPEAAERLIQQSGRLLRREDDTGVIIMLDNRLINKWYAYGKDLVEALPPFGRKKLDLTRMKYENKSVQELPKTDVKPVVSNGKIPELYDNEFNDFIF